MGWSIKLINGRWTVVSENDIKMTQRGPQFICKQLKQKWRKHLKTQTYISKDAQRRIPAEYAIRSFAGCCLSSSSYIMPPHFPLQRQQQKTRPIIGITNAAIKEREASTIKGTS